MKDMIIIGAGDFSKEIRWLIERINIVSSTWNMLGYVDDNVPVGVERDGLPILGSIDWLLESNREMDLVFAISSCKAKKSISEKLRDNQNLHFPVVIDPAAIVSKNVVLNEGVVICAGVVVMPYVQLDEYCNLNLNSTIGHDTIIGANSTIYPGCNISGKVTIGENGELGTGSKIIQGVKICNQVVLGAGCVVVRDINAAGTYVGLPARKME